MIVGLEAGTQVITQRGDVSIDQLSVGDRVLTSFGTYEDVIEKSDKIYRGAIYQFEVYGKPNLHCANNVRVYSMSGEDRVWKRADELKEKDYVCHLSVDEEGNVNSEWVRIRKRTVVTGTCRYLYGINVADGFSCTADGYIISTI